jgi:hypothetical protein
MAPGKRATSTTSLRSRNGPAVHRSATNSDDRGVQSMTKTVLEHLGAPLGNRGRDLPVGHRGRGRTCRCRRRLRVAHRAAAPCAVQPRSADRASARWIPLRRPTWLYAELTPTGPGVSVRRRSKRECAMTLTAMTEAVDAFCKAVRGGAYDRRDVPGCGRGVFLGRREQRR